MVLMSYRTKSARPPQFKRSVRVLSADGAALCPLGWRVLAASEGRIGAPLSHAPSNSRGPWNERGGITAQVERERKPIVLTALHPP